MERRVALASALLLLCPLVIAAQGDGDNRLDPQFLQTTFTIAPETFKDQSNLTVAVDTYVRAQFARYTVTNADNTDSASSSHSIEIRFYALAPKAALPDSTTTPLATTSEYFPFDAPPATKLHFDLHVYLPAVARGQRLYVVPWDTSVSPYNKTALVIDKTPDRRPAGPPVTFIQRCNPKTPTAPCSFTRAR